MSTKKVLTMLGAMFLMVAVGSTQGLGDAARQAQKPKPPAAPATVSPATAPPATVAPAKPAASEPVWAQEPATYRGVAWGTTQAEAMKILQSAGGTHPTAMGIWIQDFNQIGSVSVQEMWSFTPDKERRGGLESVVWSFTPSDFDALSVTLTGKFGEPLSRTTNAIQNRMGATFENQTLTWEGPTVVVRLQKYGSKVTEGMAGFMLKAALKKNNEAEAAKAKAAKDAF